MPLQTTRKRPWKTLIATPKMQGGAALVLCLVSAGFGARLGAGRQGVAPSVAGVPGAAESAHRPISAPYADVHAGSGPTAGVSSSAEPQVKVAAASGNGAGAVVEERDFSASQSSLPVRAPQAPAVRRAVEPRVLVPMIFQEVSPAAAGLSGAQVATISQMRSQFNDQVGSSTSPSDPQYRARWVSAQIQADDLLRAYLGWEKFNQYQIQAAQGAR